MTYKLAKRILGLNPLIFGAWVWPGVWKPKKYSTCLNPLIFGAWVWPIFGEIK